MSESGFSKIIKKSFWHLCVYAPWILVFVLDFKVFFKADEDLLFPWERVATSFFTVCFLGLVAFRWYASRSHKDWSTEEPFALKVCESVFVSFFWTLGALSYTNTFFLCLGFLVFAGWHFAWKNSQLLGTAFFLLFSLALCVLILEDSHFVWDRLVYWWGIFLFFSFISLIGVEPSVERAEMSGVEDTITRRRLEQAHTLLREQNQRLKQSETELLGHRKKLEGLTTVAQGFVDMGELSSLLDHLVEVCQHQLDSEIAMVALAHEEKIMIHRLKGAHRPSFETLVGGIEYSFLGEALLKAEPVVDSVHNQWHHINSFCHFSQLFPLLKRPEKTEGFRDSNYILRNILLVPLTTPNDRLPFGLLMVANHRKDEPYDELDVDYLKILANNAAIGLKNHYFVSRVEESHYELIQALAQAIEAKDLYTSNHIGRVRDLSVRVAEVIGFKPEEVKEIAIASMLHDVGKISTPDRILQKPGRLSDEEFEVMKAHAPNGAQILRGISSISKSIVSMVKHHHERWDGKGYPDQIGGKEIPLGAQIIAVSDCYDAMTTDRPYRKGMSTEKALSLMEEGCGTQFNAHILCAFFALFGYRPKTNSVAISTMKKVLPRLNFTRNSSFEGSFIHEELEVGIHLDSLEDLGVSEAIMERSLSQSGYTGLPKRLQIDS